MGRFLNAELSSINDEIAVKRCLETEYWFLGISSLVVAMLKPVPIGLSRNRRPNFRFHEPGLGIREMGSVFCLWKLTRHGPSSKKLPTMEEQPGPPWSQIRRGVSEMGEIGVWAS
uniref:Uncharacterized protein n=1 Tax=Cucumis sativus TaxID=3659 RepID=A0A0A0KL53_CUCSA